MESADNIQCNQAVRRGRPPGLYGRKHKKKANVTMPTRQTKYPSKHNSLPSSEPCLDDTTVRFSQTESVKNASFNQGHVDSTNSCITWTYSSQDNPDTTSVASVSPFKTPSPTKKRGRPVSTKVGLSLGKKSRLCNIPMMSSTPVKACNMTKNDYSTGLLCTDDSMSSADLTSIRAYEPQSIDMLILSDVNCTLDETVPPYIDSKMTFKSPIHSQDTDLFGLDMLWYEPSEESLLSPHLLFEEEGSHLCTPVCEITDNIISVFDSLPEESKLESGGPSGEVILEFSEVFIEKPDPNSVGEQIDEDGMNANEFYEITDRIRQYDPITGCEINEESSPSAVKYKSLREDIKQYLLCEPEAQFVMLPNELICLVQHYQTSDTPTVKCSIKVHPGGQVNVQIHHRTLSKEHSLWRGLPKQFRSFTEVKKLLVKLQRYQVCIGNYDLEYTPKQSKKAYKEGDFGAVNGSYKYSATIRTVKCDLLVPGVRCAQCILYRATLRKGCCRKKVPKPLPPGGKLSSKKPHSCMSEAEKHEKFKCYNVKTKQQERRIAQLERELKRQIAKNGALLNKADNKDMNDMIEEFDESVKEQFPDKNAYQRIFWETQKRYNCLKAKTAMRWHPSIIKWCIYMRSKSAKGYDAMRRTGFISLPSERTLFDYTHAMTSKLGIQPDFVDHLIQEAHDMGLYDSDDKTYVCILQDEIKIKEGIAYGRSTGELVGFVDLGSFNNLIDLQVTASSKKRERRPLAKNILVLMVRGLTTNLKYPLAAYATPGVTADILYPIIWQAVGYLEVDCKLKVLCITCDGASPNRKFFKMHGEQSANDPPIYSTENPYSEDERQIYFISDVPHLIKTARNCFANSFSHKQSRKLWKNGQDISWGQIVNLYETHIEPYLFVEAHKLTRAHIDLTAYSQMKVSLAAQVLSKTVANDLELHFGERYSETVKFLRIMNRFFDCLNTRHIKEALRTQNLDLAAYKTTNDERLSFLENDFLGYFEEWKTEVENRPGPFTKSQRATMTLSKQTLDGFKITVKSIVSCVRFLLNKGASFILTHKFNQDPLEEHFSHHRHKGGGHDNPSVMDVRCNMNVMRTTGSNALQPLRANVKGIKDGSRLSSAPMPRRRVKRPRPEEM